MRQPSKAPSFLIIGAQKCGTTALHSYLSLHPQIAGSTPKELHFFNSEHNYKKGTSYYDSLFSNLDENKIKFEASPSYLVNPLAAPRIYRYNPNIRLIVLLRNPIERAFSAWNMYKKRFQINRNWFRDDWLAHVEPNKSYAKRSDASLFDFNLYLTEELSFCRSSNEVSLEAPVIMHGYYYRQIRAYLDLFQRDQIFFCTNTKLKNQTAKVLYEITTFVGAESINWGSLGLVPIFEGEYDQAIPRSAKNLLIEEYKEDSEKLVGLLNIESDSDFGWIKSK